MLLLSEQIVTFFVGEANSNKKIQILEENIQTEGKRSTSEKKFCDDLERKLFFKLMSSSRKIKKSGDR